jgi:hypothetical protein
MDYAVSPDLLLKGVVHQKVLWNMEGNQVDFAFQNCLISDLVCCAHIVGCHRILLFFFRSNMP